MDLGKQASTWGQNFRMLALAVKLRPGQGRAGALGRGVSSQDALEYRKLAVALSRPEPLFPGDLSFS